MIKEIYKDILNYEGLYQISNLGNVKSLKRLDRLNKPIKEKILKQTIDSVGYYYVNLSKNGKQKHKRIHQLVAESFLNHIPNGRKLVVNHKDLNKLNNNIDNLEIVTFRENCNQKHLKSVSKYTGVHWKKQTNKWGASISIKNKKKHLGYFENEYDAHLAYEYELTKIQFLKSDDYYRV